MFGLKTGLTPQSALRAIEDLDAAYQALHAKSEALRDRVDQATADRIATISNLQSEIAVLSSLSTRL